MMDLSPRTLSNHVVTLEPMTEAHRDALREPANHPETWQLMSLRGDGPHFDDWFDGRLTEMANGQAISHVVWHKDEIVGHSAFLVITPEHARVEIGWTWYIPQVRGTMVNPACKYLLLERAFACGAERVELKTHHRNFRSQAAMRKMGAQMEGTLRHHVKMWDGSYRNSVFFSILKDEWPDVQAGLQARL